MYKTKVTENTYQAAKNLEGILFEGLWDIPNGTSVNSFIIKGDKTAIIDGFWVPDTIGELIDYLKELEINPRDVEYLVINHMEPDHSGWLQAYKKINPDVKIICNNKSKDLLEAFYGIEKNVVVMEEGEILDLGQGHELEVVYIPNVHWPDTMAMFDHKTKAIFCCDAFGSFGTIPEENYDDKLTEKQLEFYEQEAVRYYSNIVASFSTAVKTAIKKCSTLPIEIIAPGHGIVWRENPGKIIEDYVRYSNYQTGPAKNEITVIWGSMYGMTEKAVKHILNILEEEDVKVNVHRVPQDGWGAILSSAWNSTGIILAMPTYEYKMFPPMSSVLTELGKKRVQGRKAFRVGSYGWSGGAERELTSIMQEYKMNWDFIEPVEFRGVPEEKHYELMEERVKKLVEEVKRAVE